MSESPDGSLGLILASGSPRRRELIRLTGWDVEVKTVNVDESELPGEDGLGMARRLAELKVRRAADQAGGEALILAADTVVEMDGRILGKPDSNAEAKRMLLALRDRPHQVHTAIALFDPIDSSIVTDACTTVVPMRAYDPGEVEAYVSTGSPLDKAGGYGIQDGPFSPADMQRFTGCYANVVGLPICHVVRTMRKYGREPVFEVPSRCQAHTGYDCDVYPEILRDET
jgi:MAF protein